MIDKVDIKDIDNKEYWEDVEALVDAKLYLESVRKQFRDEPDLLMIYESSAIEIVRRNQSIVSEYYKVGIE